MILFTNGCSWTWGGGIYHSDDDDYNKERLETVWPSHLGNLLNAEKTVNLSVGCGNNSRIVRTTFDWIQEQTPEDLAKTVAVIQWSDYSRYEYYVPENFSNRYENIPNHWVRAKTGCVISYFEPDSKRTYERMEGRLATYTDTEGMYKHITDCDALASLFKTYNIKYYYWHFGNLVLSFPEKQQKYLLKNHTWLDDGYSHWEYDRVSKSDDHPSKTGHKQIAEIIYNKMKEKE